MKCFLRNKGHLLIKLSVSFFLFFVFTQSARAQNSLVHVQGEVNNSAGEAVANVSVVSTAGMGTTTDSAGHFAITAPRSATLKFSAIGYLSKEVTVGTASIVNVTLDYSSNSLNEVVVVGYGKQRRASVTGSVATVQGAALAKVPIANVSNALVGRLPGLISKQESGEPGFDGANISIRGFGPALIIVDGVQMDYSNLDPNEIESVTILKDAAAAIYGARSGNGVVLVTTKRGKLGKPTVSAGSSLTLQTVTNFPKPVNSGQYAEIMREAQLNSGTPPDQTRFSEEDIKKFYAGNDSSYPNTNWYKVINRDWSPLQQHNISVQGGTENIKYFGSIGYTKQDGIYRTGDNVYKRYNVRSNLDARISKNMMFSLDVSGINDITNSPQRAQGDLWANFFDAQPVYRPTLPDPTKLAFTGYPYTPLFNTSRYWGGYNDRYQTTLRGTASLTYKIPGVDGLSLRATFNYVQQSYETKYWFKHQLVYTYDAASNQYTIAGSTGNTNLTQSYFKSETLTPQLFLNYNKTFAKNHEFSALVLFESIDYLDKNFSGYREGFITNAVDYLFAGGLVNEKSNGSANQNGRASYVGRINYAFKSKYLFEATGRYDGSSVFPSDRRWGFFPSLSAGWRISEENFAKNISWIDNLKIRASYSKTGYDGVGNYQYVTGYAFGNNYLFNETTNIGITSTGLANPNISWEKIETYNSGVDFSLWKGRLYGEFDVFYRNRSGILTTRQASLPTTFGASLPLENLNSQNNRGFELLLGTRRSSNKFTYDISGNVSFSRAKWGHVEEATYTDPDQKRLYQKSNQWTDVFFGYKSDGLFTTQQEIDNWKLDQDGQGNKSLHPGDIKYIDVNGDGKLDFRDQRQIGYGSVPQLIFGVNFMFQYAGFDLSGLIQGATRFNVRINYGIDSYRTPPETLFKNRWTETNNNKNALFPRQTFGTVTNNTFDSDFWLKDASYARLKSLALGYTLPKSFLAKYGIGTFRCYVAGVNLFTVDGISKYGLDPESPQFTRGWSYPQQKTISVGINLTF